MSNEILYVGISGKKGHGKDTFANKLIIDLYNKGINAQLYHYADPIKDLVVSVFGLDPDVVYNLTPEAAKLRDEPTYLRRLDFPTCFRDDYYKHLTTREILQIMGTEIGRQNCPTIWSHAPFRKQWPEDTNVVIIPDVRFIDEVESIKENDGLVFRIIRPSVENKDSHISETALDSYPIHKFSAVLYNDGSKEKLFENYMDPVIKIIEEKLDDRHC